MKTRVFFPIIIIYFSVALAFHFIAHAAIDAPHNESNNVNCGSCHGQGLLNSPFWGGSMSYNQLCQYCHTESSCPEEDPEITGPLVQTHLDSDSNELAECRTCHDPHYQKQKNYKNTDAGQLYLAWGEIQCPVPVDDTCLYDSEDNTTTLYYSEINYKGESGWDDAKLKGKTDTCRHTILFPNVKKLGYSYPVIAIDEGAQTITVKGDARPVYQYMSSSNFAALYGQYVKDSIESSQVKFEDRKWTNSFADGNLTYNGVCEVCHTQTLYHRKDGSGAPHYPAARCTICHAHVDGFAPSDHTGSTGEDCEGCHGWDADNGGAGTTISHSTHMENDADDLKGPHITCSDCHDTKNYPFFKSGTDGNGDGKYNLSETDVCDNCHSPAGSFDGVNDPVIGAKNNWSSGVYASPTLKAGKEKWCAGCHDEAPAYSKGDNIEIIIDNTDANFATSGTGWNTTTSTQHYGTNYRYHSAGTGINTATWTPTIPKAGEYSVYAWWVDNTNRATNAPYTINHTGGPTLVTVDQKIMGQTWNYLGTYSFAAGTSGSVVLTDNANGVVVADAIKIESGIQATYAPKVIGDNTTYGFYVTGHKINCLYCHDVEKRHIDGKHRTYEVDESTWVATSYSDGYRLKGNGMVVPRPQASSNGINPGDFAFCLRCHNKDEVLGQDLNQADYSHTNFWDSMPTLGNLNNAHNGHVRDRFRRCDSDWDKEADSRETCICCHNVHGAPNGAMIRHGELISTPDTTDKVPALNFSYLAYPTGPAATGTFTAASLQAGSYNVYAWWVDNDPEYRATDAKYTIYYSGGSDAVVVDQSTNGSGGGKWNLLGTYNYDAGATGIVVLDNDYESSGMFVVADAVRWEKVGGGHEVIVDNPSAVFQNDQSAWKTYTGAPQTYGTDFRYIESHSIPMPDPNTSLVDSLGGIMNYPGVGLPDNKVCGTCHVSSHTRYIRNPNLWPKVTPVPGSVPEVVPNDGTGFTTITVTVSDPDNNVTGVTINLSQVGGSDTQEMTKIGDGTYSYLLTINAGIPDAPYTFQVTATDADANTGRGQVVLLVVDPTADIIYLDNVEAVFTGAWSYYSGHPQEYAGGFRYKAAGTGSATAVWIPTIPAAGQYAVYAWWVDNDPAYRASNAPYTIFYDSGSQTVRVDQSTNGPGGGKWNLLGTYTFAVGTSGFVQLSDDADNIVIADAIKLVPVP